MWSGCARRLSCLRHWDRVPRGRSPARLPGLALPGHASFRNVCKALRPGWPVCSTWYISSRDAPPPAFDRMLAAGGQLGLTWLKPRVFCCRSNSHYRAVASLSYTLLTQQAKNGNYAYGVAAGEPPVWDYCSVKSRGRCGLDRHSRVCYNLCGQVSI